MKIDVIKNFEKSRLYDLGFQIKVDRDNNLKFIKNEADRILVVGIPYARNTNHFFSSTSSIVFPELQKLYTDLCYSAILRGIGVMPSKKWLQEQYENATIYSNMTMEYPNGILNSKFSGYSLGEYFKDEEIEELSDVNKYIEYIDKYFEESASSFFLNVPDLYSLDSLTNNLDNYHLGLYLTGIPPLKKIVLMHIVDNLYKDEILQKYRDQISSLPTNSTIDALIHCLKKIESYFSR